MRRARVGGEGRVGVIAEEATDRGEGRERQICQSSGRERGGEGAGRPGERRGEGEGGGIRKGAKNREAFDA